MRQFAHRCLDGLRTLAVAAAFGSGWAAAVSGQSIQILEPVESGDRKVILEWTPSAADTFTPSGRVAVDRIGIPVPKSLGINSRSFLNGQQVVARGAGGQNAELFSVRVGHAGDLFAADAPPSSPAPGTFQVVAAFQFGRNLIGIAFSERVDPVTAVDPARYTLTPGVPGLVLRLQENGKTVVAEGTSSLPASTAYSVSVNGVTGADGSTLPSSGPFLFQTVATTVVNLADIQANPAAYLGQGVTVVGQVYFPAGLYSPPSGYLEDGSGRGIHLAGGPLVAAVNDRGSVAEVTGTVGNASGEPEISGYSAAVVASGLPPLGPYPVPFHAVLSPRWTGTFIETAGYISRIDRDSDPDDVVYECVTKDTLFAGYQIWRAPSEAAGDFSLLRTYSLLDSTWTFTGPQRIFADPDSIIPRGTERDPDRDPRELVPGPFNGFGYVYSITWFDALVDATVFPARTVVFDTLAASGGVHSFPVFPGKPARLSRPLLAEVKVIPNPYSPGVRSGAQAFPGPPRIQFINLPPDARIHIYTVAGDQVRELAKTSATPNDFMDWDLKNDEGNDVSSGIYLFFVEAGGETATGRFVIAR